MVLFEYIQVLKNNHCPVFWDKIWSFSFVCELEMGKTLSWARRQRGARLHARVCQVQTLSLYPCDGFC